MKAIGLIAALALFSAGAWWSFTSEKSSRLGSRSLAAESPAGSKIKKPELSYAPVAGQRYTYKFQRKIRISGLDNSIPPIEFSGQLFLDVVAAGGPGFSALVSERVDGHPISPVALKITADRAGEKLEIFSRTLDSEEDRQHESILKDLLSQLFFPMRTDTVGRYDARFEVLAPEHNFLKFKKIKLSYLSGKNTPEIISSWHTLKWNSAIQMPQEVSGAEATRLGKDETGISSDAEYQLEFQSASPFKKIKRSVWAALADPVTLDLAAQKHSLKDHPDYASLHWPDLMKLLQRVDSLAPGEQLQLFGDIVKMLQSDGSYLGDLLSALRTANATRLGADSAVFQTVVGALATAGTPEAQQALREIYSDPDCPVSGKGSILSSLTTTQASADAHTNEFLAGIMEQEKNRDLAQGAAYALGSSLEAAKNPSDAENSISRILDAWKRAQAGNLADQLSILDVMGNSGRQEFFPILSGVVLNSNKPELRAKAVFSLRFIASSGAVALLGTTLISDAEPSVRSAAITGIGFAGWNEGFRRPLMACSTAESNSSIKAACEQINARAPIAVAQGH